MVYQMLGTQRRALEAAARNRNEAAMSLLGLQSPTSPLLSPVPSPTPTAAMPTLPAQATDGHHQRVSPMPDLFSLPIPNFAQGLQHLDRDVLTQVNQNQTTTNDEQVLTSSSEEEEQIPQETLSASEYFETTGQNKMPCLFAMAIGLLTSCGTEPLADTA